MIRSSALVTLICSGLLCGLALGPAVAQPAPPASPASPPAKAAAGAGRQCFRPHDINGFNAPNEHTLYVRVGIHDIYRLDLMGDCGELTFRQSIGLETFPGLGWVCSPLDATVVYRETGIPERCPVTAIHKLSADEIAALPKRDRP